MQPYGRPEKENVLKLAIDQFSKSEWREWMRKLLQGSAEDTIRQASGNVNEKLKQLLTVREVKTLHSFLPKDREIDIYPTIKWAMKNKLTVVVPRVLEKPKLKHLHLTDLKDLKPGRFGTKFPGDGKVHPGPYDLIIVPGLVFDMEGNRIGHGTGYYDVFLAKQKHAFKVGVCYRFQLVDKLPVESHDIVMDMVLTEE